METLFLFVRQIASELKPVEIAAAATSLLCVYLSVKNNIWNWVWGLVGSVLYGYIFFRVSHLYANAALQLLYFVPMQFVGYYVWLRGNPEKSDALPVTALSPVARVAWCAATAGLSVGLYYGLPPLVGAFHLPPQQLSALDCFTTGLSIVAQYLQTVKKFENWIFWIIADVVYTVYVFPQLKMPVTTGLYAIFTVLAVIGARDWYRLIHRPLETPCKP